MRPLILAWAKILPVVLLGLLGVCCGSVSSAKAGEVLSEEAAFAATSLLQTGTSRLRSVAQDDKLVLGRELGVGSFGAVHQTEWIKPDGTSQTVATKIAVDTHSEVVMDNSMYRSVSVRNLANEIRALREIWSGKFSTPPNSIVELFDFVVAVLPASPEFPQTLELVSPEEWSRAAPSAEMALTRPSFDEEDMWRLRGPETGSAHNNPHHGADDLDLGLDEDDDAMMQEVENAALPHRRPQVAASGVDRHVSPAFDLRPTSLKLRELTLGGAEGMNFLQVRSSRLGREDVNDDIKQAENFVLSNPKTQLFAVLELCRGKELSFHLKRPRGMFSETEPGVRAGVYRVMRQLLGAIHFLSGDPSVRVDPTGASRRPMSHRDVKPENIMLCDGKPELAKLIDFGTAAFLPAEGFAGRADVSAFSLEGTNFYLPPEAVCVGYLDGMACPKYLQEVANAPNSYTSENFFARDMWAAGTVFYMLLLQSPSPWNEDRPTSISGSLSRSQKQSEHLAMRRTLRACTPSPDKEFNIASHSAKIPLDAVINEFGEGSSVVRLLRGLFACSPSARISPKEALALLDSSALNPAYVAGCRAVCKALCSAEADKEGPSLCHADCEALVLPPSLDESARQNVCPGLAWKTRCPHCGALVVDRESHEKHEHGACELSPALVMKFCNHQSQQDQNSCERSSSGKSIPTYCLAACTAVKQLKQKQFCGNCEQLAEVLLPEHYPSVVRGQVSDAEVGEGLAHYWGAANLPVPDPRAACREFFTTYNCSAAYPTTIINDFLAQAHKLRKAATNMVNPSGWLSVKLGQSQEVVAFRLALYKEVKAAEIYYASYMRAAASKLHETLSSERADSESKKCAAQLPNTAERLATAAVQFSSTVCHLADEPTGPTKHPAPRTWDFLDAVVAARARTPRPPEKLWELYQQSYIQYYLEFMNLAVSTCEQAARSVTGCRALHLQVAKRPRLKVKKSENCSLPQ
eukprot:gnl/Hemi2/25265_TR8503_c0_g2_i1.p1 gnl/Hemi2/25265_TR8503_c0_g2~~gnl/Hemi2/25265_TR8503_c0_g2_i1.p1  ORF type:complete len:1010 (-),score=265.38 gnl/Hemi2/25265_TR8503_c0_g2_i1:54-2981(-)